MNLPIQGLQTIMNEETLDTYYVNKQMIEAGVYIKHNTFENEEIPLGTWGCIESIVEVGCLNDNKTYAGRFIMFWDPLLNGIELYRIVKDLYDLYLDNNKENFIKILKMLSNQYYDSTLEGRSDLVAEVKIELNNVEYDMKGRK